MSKINEINENLIKQFGSELSYWKKIYRYLVFLMLTSSLSCSSLKHTNPTNDIATNNQSDKITKNNPADPLPRKNVKRIFMVILENTNAYEALAQPFLKKLAHEGALLDEYFGITHPSQPNYIALIAGDTMGVKGDANENLDGKMLIDLIEEKGLTWKSYNDGYPGNCFLEERSKKYVRKHQPFLSFKSVQSDPKKCSHIVSSNELEKDVASGKLAHFNLFIPDLNNDGHDTGAKYAERWLAKTFGNLLKNPAFIKDTLFIVTFDESNNIFSNRIYTSLFGQAIKSGYVSEKPYNHYSMLKTIESLLGLESLNRKDLDAALIDDVWN